MKREKFDHPRTFMRLPSALAQAHNGLNSRKGDDMKKASIVFALVLIAGLGLSGDAFACSRRCANVAPPGSVPCLRCIEDSAVASDCRNGAGVCGCVFVICHDFSQATAGKDEELASIFSADTKAVACSTLPTEITEAVAD
jgi:hypothetical protein